MGVAQTSIGGTYAAGWNLAEEFVNMDIGHGGEFFKPGSAEVAVNNAQGAATLEMMKSLTAYMNPDYLTHDSNATNAEMEAGNLMMMNMWDSRMLNLPFYKAIAFTLAFTFVVTPLMWIMLMDNFRVFEPIISFSASAHATSLSWAIFNDLGGKTRQLSSAAATSVLTVIGVIILLTPVLIRTWRDFGRK